MTWCWSLWSNLFFASHSTQPSFQRSSSWEPRTDDLAISLWYESLSFSRQGRKLWAFAIKWSPSTDPTFCEALVFKPHAAQEAASERRPFPNIQGIQVTSIWVAREARGKEVCSQSVMTSVERKDQPQSRQLKRCTRDSAVWIHTVALNLLYQPIHPWLNIPCVFFLFPLFVGVNFGGQRTKDRSIRLPPSASFHARESCKKPSWWAHFVAWSKVIPTSKFGSTSQGETLDIRMFDVTFFVYEHSRAIYWGSLGECNILNAVLFSALNFGREWVMIHTHIQEVVELWIVDFNNLTTLQALKGTVCQLNWSGLHFALPSQLVFRNHSSTFSLSSVPNVSCKSTDFWATTCNKSEDGTFAMKRA